MPETTITCAVNGHSVERTVPDHRLCRDFLREDLELTGTKAACEDGMCGSCSVHLDGEVIKSCLLLAVELDGRTVTTIEGLARDSRLHPVQQAFIDNFGFQCGFCTPGFVMTVSALVRDQPEMTAEQAREALVGNICRCTGYTKIVESCLDAARRALGKDREAPGRP
jgi:aerobic carbon-monoxide dehydrogenase small subunit